MLTYSSTINEIFTHVHEVLASQVVRKMIQQLGLTDIFKNHLYINSDVTGPSRSYNGSRLPILNENAFRCNIKYSTNPFSLKWDVTTPGQHMDPGFHRWDNLRTPPVFHDPKHHITLTERYIPCNIELDCNMIFVDRVVAFDVMNRITSTYVRGELLMVNDLSYNYSLPDGILFGFTKLANLLEIKCGTYTDWLYENSNGQIQRIVSTRSRNRSSELVVQKHIWSSLASVDYVPDSPEFASFGTSPDTITLHFTTTIQFGRVNMLYLTYPEALNNKLVPESMVHVDLQDAYGSLYPFLHHPEYALDPAYQFQKCLMSHPAHSPWYDNWTPPTNSSISAAQQRPFFIGLFTLDNRNCECDKCKCNNCEYKYTKINLAEDLDEYKLAPNVLKWLQEHPRQALYPDGMYSITAFRNNIQIDPSMLKFDGTVFEFPNCYGPANLYHIVISAATRELKDGNPWTMLMLVFDINAKREKL